MNSLLIRNDIEIEAALQSYCAEEGYLSDLEVTAFTAGFNAARANRPVTSYRRHKSAPGYDIYVLDSEINRACFDRVINSLIGQSIAVSDIEGALLYITAVDVGEIHARTVREAAEEHGVQTPVILRRV